MMTKIFFAMAMVAASASETQIERQTECLDRCLAAERACLTVNQSKPDGKCRCEMAECSCRAACGVPCVRMMYCEGTR